MLKSINAGPETSELHHGVLPRNSTADGRLGRPLIGQQRNHGDNFGSHEALELGDL